jgi:hypothetical protein
MTYADLIASIRAVVRPGNQADAVRVEKITRRLENSAPRRRCTSEELRALIGRAS